MKRTKDLLIEMMQLDEELGLYEYEEKKYSDRELCELFIELMKFKHFHEEPIEKEINKFLSQLNSK